MWYISLFILQIYHTQGICQEKRAACRSHFPTGRRFWTGVLRFAYSYRGYLPVSWATWARSSSCLPSKSVAVRHMMEAMTSMSASLKPRVVAAGVPTRMPLVTKGFSGSLGMAFLLTVMFTSSSRLSISLPVRRAGRRSTSIRWLSVPPLTRSKPSAMRAFARAAAFLRICSW